MGCGSSKVNEVITDHFEIDFFTVDKSKSISELSLKRLYKENFELKPKQSILNYLKASSEKFIKIIFEEFSTEENKKNKNQSKNFICIFNFWNSKIPKIKLFEDAKNFQPFEENILHKECKIKKLVIITMQNFTSLGVEKKEFYNELDAIIKADNTGNWDFADKKLKLKTDEISIHESDVDEEKIENELLEGMNLIFIYKSCYKKTTIIMNDR